ncbi:MAG: D-alanyl-D-alanine carboxypeptidase/D-alanyl-D-alanine-endopeptidase [Saprospiraceae bacterium]|nr:D-alanyl-D-alanine carboxypeptidase/D-alanyl-D-alanine-endopeptidase [Saprospiraceae bacterium]
MKTISFLWLILSSSVGLVAQSGIKNEVKIFCEDPCFSHASLSMYVADLTNDDVIIEHQSQSALPPASLVKIFTTLAGLQVLGTDFVFRTQIGFTGSIEVDQLVGDLIIRGSGDPSLGSRYTGAESFAEFLDIVVNMVKAQGIRSIKGDIVGDSQALPKLGVGRTWPYQDLGNYYGAGAYGLNVHDNLFYIRFTQSATGNPANVQTTYPEVPGLTLLSRVISGEEGSGDQAYVFAAPFQEELSMHGSIPPGSHTFTIKGALPDPAKFLAHHVKKKLIAQGITVEGEARSNYLGTSQSFTLLDEIASDGLAEIVAIANQHSVNLYAEAIGRQLEREIGSYGSNALTSFFNQVDADVRGCRFTDYAGLAPDNAITAKAMVNVLHYIHAEPTMYQTFLQSMAIAGHSGTMRHMFRNSRAKGKIFAKSGLIEGTRNYAGYMHAPSGDVVAFCIMTFNAECDRKVVQGKLEQLLESVYLSLQ